jgi:hypothetical protein
MPPDDDAADTGYIGDLGDAADTTDLPEKEPAVGAA